MSFGFINSMIFSVLLFPQCVSGLSIVAASGDVFYTLPSNIEENVSFWLGGGGSCKLKKTNFLLLLKPFDKIVIIKMVE